MPKQCEGCGFYSVSNDPSKCPECGGTLKFTFLPPAGKNAAPIAGLPTDPVNELSRRHRAEGGSRIHWGLVKAICAALVTVTIMGVRFYLRQEARDQREAQQTAAVDKIRPGMHISQAARLLESGSNMPEWHGSTRHDFDPGDDSDGSMEVNDGRNDLKITWRNGYVTSIERADGSGGTRRRATYVTADPDEDDGGITDPQTGEVTHPAERVIARPNGSR
ncbi:hypothetical protein J0H58_00120 [bacterium]|nr:hypothetical protein [bacterium]